MNTKPQNSYQPSSLNSYDSMQRSNVDKLVSMGFANRSLNERLLKKFNNDVDKVVESLIDRFDNDWALNR